jgi:hypothetical protein
VTELQEAIDRVRRYLNTRDSMPHLDSEEIHGVGSAASGHETVALLTSDLRVLLEAAGTAQRASFGLRRMADEVTGDVWFNGDRHPGPTVTEVIDALGLHWTQTEDGWWTRDGGRPQINWALLTNSYGPITDATPEAATDA